MRNTVAKRLRKEALHEMIGDGVPKRDLVMGHHSVINSPQSVRALYLRLKSAWKNLGIGTPAYVPTRLRKPSGFTRKQDLRTGPALILSPFKQLKRLFPGSTTPAGNYEPSHIVSLAQLYVDRGQGGKLQHLARQFV